MNVHLPADLKQMLDVIETQGLMRKAWEALQEIAALKRAFLLQPMQARFLWSLAQGGYESAAMLVSAWQDCAQSEKAVSVHMRRLRVALASSGIVIECEWGLGFRIRPRDLQLIRNVMAKGRQEAGL